MATPTRRRKKRREEGETATADSLINGINRGFKEAGRLSPKKGP
jgi:hypothetical protein